jgi:hypothetical protein
MPYRALAALARAHCNARGLCECARGRCITRCKIVVAPIPGATTAPHLSRSLNLFDVLTEQISSAQPKGSFDQLSWHRDELVRSSPFGVALLLEMVWLSSCNAHSRLDLSSGIARPRASSSSRNIDVPMRLRWHRTSILEAALAPIFDPE